jgi:hypothetical protein
MSEEMEPTAGWMIRDGDETHDAPCQDSYSNSWLELANPGYHDHNECRTRPHLLLPEGTYTAALEPDSCRSSLGVPRLSSSYSGLP